MNIRVLKVAVVHKIVKLLTQCDVPGLVVLGKRAGMTAAVAGVAHDPGADTPEAIWSYVGAPVHL